MKVIFNQDTTLELEEGTTVTKLLEIQGLKKEGVAVAVNEQIVKKANFDDFKLTDGCSVDVFNMVSGG
jgi:sulfur carrier protein